MTDDELERITHGAKAFMYGCYTGILLGSGLTLAIILVSHLAVVWK